MARLRPNYLLYDAFRAANAMFGQLTAEQINSGRCMNWALKVYDLIEGSKIAGHSIEGHGHSYIEVGGICFDAECWYGVEDWQCLPFFQRVLQGRCWYEQSAEERWFERDRGPGFRIDLLP